MKRLLNTLDAMTEFKKQHYTFTFRNPESDPTFTSWDGILAKGKLKKDSKEINLEEAISSTVKKPSDYDKLDLTNRFIAVVEKFLSLNN